MAILPNILLLGQLRIDTEQAYWNETDGSEDPFVGFPYRWTITLTLQTQPHSSPSTPTPFEYNGFDIEEGDWIASGSGGMSVQVQEIVSANRTSVQCVVEDVERFNLFSNPAQDGNGMIQEGNCIVFRTGDDELPILGPVPDYHIPNNAVNDLEARFLTMNSDEFVLVRQEGHDVTLGDLIYADPVNLGGYLKTDAANIGNAVGIVVKVNIPSVNYFHYRPLGSLVTRVKPPLAGVHGTIFYADPANPGKMTSVKPLVNPRPIYMRLDRPDRAILIGRPAESSSSSGSETHKYDVENVVSGQTAFTMPLDCIEVLYMSINGIENENFVFDQVSKALTFDPVETGYGVDVDDDVFFFYKS